ncbi:MAG: hypothetical protein ABI382_07860 [Nakamurella sp.]
MGDEIGRNVSWFYCLRHHSVEREGECKATDRLGPYPSPDAAAHALESVHEREDRLEQEDREWTGTPPAETE